MAKATFTSGNKEQSVIITGSKNWSSADNSQQRVYFDLRHSGDSRKGVDKLYKVIVGDTGRDMMVTGNGSVYGFVYSIGVDSKTKKAAVGQAIMELIGQM
jgi:hypothetical protein